MAFLFVFERKILLALQDYEHFLLDYYNKKLLRRFLLLQLKVEKSEIEDFL